MLPPSLLHKLLEHFGQFIYRVIMAGTDIFRNAAPDMA
jgi:hypothetical protein